MRKLRRLPWRIPKNNHDRPSAPAADAAPRVDTQAEIEREAQREAYRESLNAQPVAFAGGRYVYGETPSVARPARAPEIRRKARHHTILVPV